MVQLSAWVPGTIGPVIGVPAWGGARWGGNGGVDNGLGPYGHTAPPPGVTSGAALGSAYCGVLPVLAAAGRGYGYLTKITKAGTLVDSTGANSGTVTVDAGTGTVGVTVTRAGAVLEYLDIVGQLSIRARNVTVRYCRVGGRSPAAGNTCCPHRMLIPGWSSRTAS